MSVLNALSMRKKVLLAPSFAVALMVASAAAAYLGIAQLRSSLRSICQERIPAIKNAAEADRILAGVQTNTYKLLAMTDANFPVEKVHAAAKDIRQDLTAARERLQAAAQVPGIPDEDKARFESAVKLVIEYHRMIEQVIEVGSIKVAMATSLQAEDVVRAMSKAQVKYDELAWQLKALREIEDRKADNAYHSAKSVAWRASSLVVAAMVLSVVLSVVVAVLVAANIVSSIAAIRAATAKLSEGDLRQHVAQEECGVLECEIDVDRQDEIGDLARSFSTMVSYLEEMAATSEAIAGGDLSNRVEPRSGHDTLGNAFVRMTEGLGVLVCSVRDSAAQVAGASGQVAKASEEAARVSVQASAAIDEVTSTMHEMRASVQNVVKSTKAQASSVNETSASIDQMVASIQRVANTANALLDIANRSRQEVQTGITSMSRATDGLTRINTSIHSSAAIIKVLGGRADDIGKITEVIDDLAEQTNLLALNAAIEAARAGEHGLGFAVVADEVRKLAEKSVESTKEISELIQSIQKEAHKAVEDMEKSTTIVNEGLVLGADLSAALKRISDVVTDLDKLAQQIGSATKEQSHGSSQIARATTLLNEITQEINSSIEEQATGTDAVVRAMEGMRDLVQQSTSSSAELAASAEQMSKMACSLVELMGRFKLALTDNSEQEVVHVARAAARA